MTPSLQISGCLIVVITAIAVATFRRLRHNRGLEEAVRERTEELERERSREKARNQVLELLVTNQPLELILDRIAELVCGAVPNSLCVIALNKSDRPQLFFASGVSQDMRAAFRIPHAIPFEVWLGAAEFRAPLSDPAWKILLAGLPDLRLAAIRTRVMGRYDQPLGAFLMFECEDAGGEKADRTLDDAVGLAQLAVEHSRFCENLNFQAHHDGLTGLPNRVLFEQRLSHALSEARANARKLAVLFIDLDRLKQINDTMSHRIGDLFLTETGARMRNAVRPCDTVARIGGDEFTVLLSGIGGVSEAEATAERILEAIRQPLAREGHSVVSSASIGIAMFPDDALEIEELLRAADAAMYCAKGLGRDRVQCFSARNHTLDRVRMHQELTKALRDRLFFVVYQPKVDATGRFAGFEALLRLSHPLHGAIPPNDFIPLAEESGLIVPLGLWVLDDVCRQIAEWTRSGAGQVAVAVNVSPLQICRPDFAKDVEECLRRHRVSPLCLELELTESLLIGSGDETQRQMKYLRGLGIRFSIDDFGTGYSSLSYLHRLPVDAIKLDRSFVKFIDTDSAARRLVQAMIGVAEGLGLGVIAEGVETEAQRAVLIAAGCPTMQGFLFSQPRTPADLEDYLRASPLRSSPSDTDDLIRIESVCAPASGIPADTETI
jgi:diguanylate cyclase (GGDEF)-like protein